MDTRFTRAWLVLVLVLLLSSTQVNAATTADVKNLYGIESAKDVSEIERRLFDARELLYSAAVEDLYSAATGLVNTQVLDLELSAQVIRIAEIKLEMATAIDYSLNDILALETEYRMRVESVNNLLAIKDTYDIDTVSVDYEYDDLQHEISLIWEELQGATRFEDIGDLANFKGPLVSTYVTSGFGRRYDPMGQLGVQVHTGLDMRAAEGTSVYAPFHATVTSTGYSQAGGYYVWLNHGDGIRTYYCHLSEILVEQGDLVTQYQEFAKSGNTGTRSTGPHLHWSLQIEGEYVDPSVLYTQQEVNNG